MVMVLPTRFSVTLPKFYYVALIDHDVHSDEYSVNGPLYFAVQAIQVRLNLVCERKYKAIGTRRRVSQWPVLIHSLSLMSGNETKILSVRALNRGRWAGDCTVT